MFKPYRFLSFSPTWTDFFIYVFELCEAAVWLNLSFPVGEAYYFSKVFFSQQFKQIQLAVKLREFF
jgi:hypothetical protein